MSTNLAALADALDRLRDASTVRIGHGWTAAMAGLDAQRDAHDAVYTALAAILRAVADAHTPFSDDDPVHRYTALMGYPPAESDCDRWWPMSGGTAVDHGPA